MIRGCCDVHLWSNLADIILCDDGKGAFVRPIYRLIRPDLLVRRHHQSPAFKFRLVFFAFKSCIGRPFSRASVDRSGKIFVGLFI